MGRERNAGERKKIFDKLKNYRINTCPIDISEINNMVNEIQLIVREGEFNSNNQKVIEQLSSFLDTQQHRFFGNFKPAQNIEAEVNKLSNTLTELLKDARDLNFSFKRHLTQPSTITTDQVNSSNQETGPHQKIITDISGKNVEERKAGFRELIKLIQEDLTDKTQLTNPITDLLSKVLATRNGDCFFALAMCRNITDKTSKDRIIEILEKQGFKWDKQYEASVDSDSSSGFVGMNMIGEYEQDFTMFH